jgi:hypothetical protein
MALIDVALGFDEALGEARDREAYVGRDRSRTGSERRVGPKDMMPRRPQPRAVSADENRRMQSFARRVNDC